MTIRFLLLNDAHQGIRHELQSAYKERGDVSLPTSGNLFADPAYEFTRAISSRARDEGYKVLLSGQGGDELFGGYRRHIVASALARASTGAVGASQLQRLGGSVRAEYLARLGRASAHRDPFAGLMELSTYSTAEQRAAALGCYAGEVANEEIWSQHRDVWDSLPDDLPFLRRALTLDLRVYMPALGLAYVDRAGMEFGVEIRVPWLDIDLVRWSLNLPQALLVRRGQGKRISRLLAERHLGKEVARHPKMSFGAPASALPVAQKGGVGFRQDQYFALATQLLQRHRARPAPSA